MKKKIIVHDLVAENRKLQDTFKKRLNEGFFDNVLKKVGMGEPEAVKQKKVSSMTPKEQELYDKAKAAAGTAAEDAAWAEYEAEKYGSPGKSPVLGKQETPMAQELQKKTVEELAKDMGIDFTKIKMNFDGTIDYDGEFRFDPIKHIDDKNSLILPMRKVSSLSFSKNVKGDPFKEYKGMPKEVTYVDVQSIETGNGEHPWFESFNTGQKFKEYLNKSLNAKTIDIKYKWKYELNQSSGRSDDYEDQMSR